MGVQAKLLGWVIAGLVVVLAALTILIVRSSAQPEPPDLTPIEVTPGPAESSAPSAPPESSGADEPSESDSPPGEDDDSQEAGRASSANADSDSSGTKQIEPSFEPAPNPPREVPDDDDDDIEDDDGGDDDD